VQNLAAAVPVVDRCLHDALLSQVLRYRSSYLRHNLIRCRSNSLSRCDRRLSVSRSKHYAHAVAESLKPEQMRTYFALTEAASLLEYAVRQQLQAEGNLSYVQFEILAKLFAADRPLTMTDLADGVVYSRSGLTHQAGLLEKAGLITRGPSPDDQRATVVDITKRGRALIDKVLPGHQQVVRELLFEPLSRQDVRTLGDIMSRARDHMRARPPRSAARRR
jgi:DNA-binding MarR family transcriptional regulator